MSYLDYILKYYILVLSKRKSFFRFIHKYFLNMPSEYPYKVVDFEEKNGFVINVKTQVRGKNIILNEHLHEIISRDSNLTGYSPADVSLITTALYDWKYKERYVLTNINYEVNGKHIIVLKNIRDGFVQEVSISDLLDDDTIFSHMESNSRKVLFKVLVQSYVDLQNRYVNELEGADNLS